MDEDTVRRLRSLALSRPIARIHLASREDRIDDPALQAAWAIHRIQDVNGSYIPAYPFMCSWCGDMTSKICCGCFRKLGAAVPAFPVSSGLGQAALGVGHCQICIDHGLLVCRECHGMPVVEMGEAVAEGLLNG